MQGFEVSDGFRRLGGGGEDRARVVSEQVHPVVDVLCMVGARVLGDAEFGTEERRADFRDEFLGGDFSLEKALGQIAVAALFRRRPMNFMPISA